MFLEILGEQIKLLLRQFGAEQLRDVVSWDVFGDRCWTYWAGGIVGLSRGALGTVATAYRCCVVSENEDPRVRPIEPTGIREPQARRTAVKAAVVAGVGIAALVFFAVSNGSEPGVDSTTALATPETFAVPSSPTTTINPPASTTSTSTGSARKETLSDLLPENRGVLVVAITRQAAADLELVRWPPATPPRSLEIPMLGGPMLEFDGSGQHMAFLGRSATVEVSALYVGSPDSWAPARIGVSSFRWHSTVGSRIGWMEPGDPPRLCWADTDLAEGISTPTCVPGMGDNLVGFDPSGFLVVDYAARTVRRLDASGQQVAGMPGTDALIGPDGQVLVVNQAPDGRESSFSVADPDLATAVLLDWAPANASGEYGFVAWSPVGHPPELAFLVFDQGRQQLQRWDLDGTPRRAVNLSGRVWDVKWDSTGRYLLAPGVIDVGDHVLQVYDTFSEALVVLPFDNWIQDAHLVTPAVCQTAAHVAATFVDRLPTDVTLGTAWMVLSRVANLESWYFISARVVGGPFNGQLASWALPGFDGISVDTTNTPNLAVPINEAATYLGFGMTTLNPVNYGVDDWLQLDGALASQRCVPSEAP